MHIAPATPSTSHAPPAALRPQHPCARLLSLPRVDGCLHQRSRPHGLKFWGWPRPGANATQMAQQAHQAWGHCAFSHLLQHLDHWSRPVRACTCPSYADGWLPVQACPAASAGLPQVAPRPTCVCASASAPLMAAQSSAGSLGRRSKPSSAMLVLLASACVGRRVGRGVGRWVSTSDPIDLMNIRFKLARLATGPCPA